MMVQMYGLTCTVGTHRAVSMLLLLYHNMHCGIDSYGHDDALHNNISVYLTSLFYPMCVM